MAQSKNAKKQKKSNVTKAKKMSALDPAARVLTETRQPMTRAELIEAMAAKRFWTSPQGKTPAATLYSALLREINSKGAKARFRKIERPINGPKRGLRWTPIMTSTPPATMGCTTTPSMADC
jgi:hypothetical protein